jgi:hypothetical protein
VARKVENLVVCSMTAANRSNAAVSDERYRELRRSGRDAWVAERTAQACPTQNEKTSDQLDSSTAHQAGPVTKGVCM